MDLSDLRQLNLPDADIKVSVDTSGKAVVYDCWRKKWVALTPEEWVRQHFAWMLVRDKGYMPGRIGNEVSITLNGTARRCDTVVFDARMQPYMIVEYKAPEVALSQRVFDQIVRYNMVLQARYLTVSNGMEHYCCEIDYKNRTYRFLRDIPVYNP